MIKRIYSDIDKLLETENVLIIYGPRQVGKTTLLHEYIATTLYKYRFDRGDFIRIQEILSSKDEEMLRAYVGDNKLVIVDEAQMVPEIGKNLKILTDVNPNLKIVVTGSSSFALAGQVDEPLVGRKTTVKLYPFSQMELLKEEFDNNKFDLKQKLNDFLIFGSYPKVYLAKTKEKKIKILNDMVDSHIIKDVLAVKGIKSSSILYKLLRLVAFQVGNEVSFSELGKQLDIKDPRIIDRYLDLLEKSFIIFHLGGFATNLRKEVTGKYKYFFYDNGIRNALIKQYNDIDYRNDIGALWENFIISERLKKREYTNDYANAYFWRSYEQQEIDLVEEKDEKVFTYEIKWSVKKYPKVPTQWREQFPDAKYTVINKENYLNFIA